MIAKFLQVGDLAADGCSFTQRQGWGFMWPFAFIHLGQIEQLREPREQGLNVALAFVCCRLNLSLLPEISLQLWRWNSLWKYTNPWMFLGEKSWVLTVQWWLSFNASQLFWIVIWVTKPSPLFKVSIGLEIQGVRAVMSWFYWNSILHLEKCLYGMGCFPSLAASVCLSIFCSPCSLQRSSIHSQLPKTQWKTTV